MRFAYRIVNVFTVDGDRLSGNPLCVFEDGRGLSDARMQALALQLNLSETTFVLPSERATARVRIFTPAFEMPFAGHPTLGTAHVVRALRGGDRVTLEMRAGLVEVRAAGDTWTLRAARVPTTRAPGASRAELARMLALPEAAIAGEPLWVNTGSDQLVIPLRSADDVRAAVPVPELIERHATSEARGEGLAYAWSPEGVVRFFFTKHGSVIEDPATGSAAANLGGYFVATGRALPIAMTLRQGDAVGRPSRLNLHVTAERHIEVSGDVIELGGGAFEL
ncbi:MAG TPA: PhzF family phenazine biosynthesis protein [Kofleriaceae bacterium]|nr:PhzF family phenazine biosynthesis protein [Kofleriaceae bacterium]